MLFNDAVSTAELNSAERYGEIIVEGDYLKGVTGVLQSRFKHSAAKTEENLLQ